jgi:hypothetical protein
MTGLWRSVLFEIIFHQKEEKQMKNYVIFGVCRAFFYITGSFGFMT